MPDTEDIWIVTAMGLAVSDTGAGVLGSSP